MGKKSAPRRFSDNEAMAFSKSIRISPQKLNLVAGLIRGKDASKALADLGFSPKRVAGDVKRVLESAIANAEHNQGLDIDRLFISTIFVDESFTMKRIRPRARGRADRFFKRNCNIKLTLEEIN